MRQKTIKISNGIIEVDDKGTTNFNRLNMLDDLAKKLFVNL